MTAAPPTDESGQQPLGDFPLRAEPPLELTPFRTDPTAPVVSGFASLPDRALGTAADAATAILLVSVALLGAFAARVVPLVLFGRTVGMALAGLSVRGEGSSRQLTLSEAARRWAGTLATLAGFGIPLFWTARDPGAPTLADRLSGRTLVRDG